MALQNPLQNAPLQQSSDGSPVVLNQSDTRRGGPPSSALASRRSQRGNPDHSPNRRHSLQLLHRRPPRRLCEDRRDEANQPNEKATEPYPAAPTYAVHDYPQDLVTMISYSIVFPACDTTVICTVVLVPLATYTFFEVFFTPSIYTVALYPAAAA